jgi:hypothetical protein
MAKKQQCAAEGCTRSKTKKCRECGKYFCRKHRKRCRWELCAKCMPVHKAKHVEDKVKHVSKD